MTTANLTVNIFSYGEETLEHLMLRLETPDPWDKEAQ